MDDGYTFDGLPLADIRPGTSVLVTGPVHGGSQGLALRMLAGSPGEGAIIVTTNTRAARIAESCSDYGIAVGEDRTAILDCVGDEEPDVPAQVLPVSGPADLTGIGMRFSDVYVDFRGADIERVRTGICSVSTLLSFGDVKTVSRFVHTLAGRIDSVDGLGVFLVDPSMHDDRTVSTIAQFCTGRITVRETDGENELRVKGLPNQPQEWTAFDPVCE